MQSKRRLQSLLRSFHVFRLALVNQVLKLPHYGKRNVVQRIVLFRRYVYAEQTSVGVVGVESHGVMRVLEYADEVKSGVYMGSDS